MATSATTHCRPRRSSSPCSRRTSRPYLRAWRTEDQASLGARLTAVYTALSRAEWALARVAPGEGALAGKFTHPSVAPYLRALQRLYPQVEALL